MLGLDREEWALLQSEVYRQPDEELEELLLRAEEVVLLRDVGGREDLVIGA